MLVVVASQHSTTFFLGAHLAVLDPLVVHDLFQRGALLWIDFEHSPNDMSTLSGE